MLMNNCTYVDHDRPGKEARGENGKGNSIQIISTLIFIDWKTMRYGGTESRVFLPDLTCSNK